MSYELMGIILLGVLEIVGLVVSLIVTMRGFREISWIQKAIAGLIVQESEKIQALLRASG